MSSNFSLYLLLDTFRVTTYYGSMEDGKLDLERDLVPIALETKLTLMTSSSDEVRDRASTDVLDRSREHRKKTIGGGLTLNLPPDTFHEAFQTLGKVFGVEPRDVTPAKRKISQKRKVSEKQIVTKEIPTVSDLEAGVPQEVPIRIAIQE